MTAGETSHFNSRNVENDLFAISAASAVTVYMGNGTDTATTRYLNLPANESYGINIVPTVACSITEINGRTLKAAISVPVLGYVEPNIVFSSIKIQAGSATVIEVEGKC